MRLQIVCKLDNGKSDHMRLDKFLKVSRLVKRRTLAKEVADKGRVTVNGNQAKAASDISVGDEIIIQFGQKKVTIRVNSLKEVIRKDESDMLYTVIGEEKIQ